MKSKRPLGRRLRVGLVVPHIFMQDAVLPHVIFSPGTLALLLADGLVDAGADVALYSPGPVTVGPGVRNVTADLSLFRQELAGRGYGYVELLKKHPMTFIAMARQVQAELIALAFAAANRGDLDIVHIYTNEEDIALPFAQFCARPVVFTHHDPFSFLIKYKNNFPKYKHLNWISLSLAQRADMPADTNWAANIYHGLPTGQYAFQPVASADPYVVYLGRIVEPKGVHLAIAAVKQYNVRQRAAGKPVLRLKIAGKHYAGHAKDTYWQDRILPQIDDDEIQYVGFAKTVAEKQTLLGGAQALLMPSLFSEPFGMVAIESIACGTPVIGLDSGAISEVVKGAGVIVPGPRVAIQERQQPDEDTIVGGIAAALEQVDTLSRYACRQRFQRHFTAERMCRDHLQLYCSLSGQSS